MFGLVGKFFLPAVTNCKLLFMVVFPSYSYCEEINTAVISAEFLQKFII